MFEATYGVREVTLHDIVFSMNIAGDDECTRVMQGILCLGPPTRPSDERPPVMYGHFLGVSS